MTARQATAIDRRYVIGRLQNLLHTPVETETETLEGKRTGWAQPPNTPPGVR
jgi:hypothetical protein